jgi:hypothetical protein
VEKNLLLSTRDLDGTDVRAPICRCDECDGPMDFDDLEPSYFAFVKQAPRIIDETNIDEIIAQFGRAAGQAPEPEAPGSLPSVPSVPSASTSGRSGSARSGSPFGTTLGGRLTSAALSDLDAKHALLTPLPPAPGRRNRMWWVAIGVVLVSAAVAGYFAFARM